VTAYDDIMLKHGRAHRHLGQLIEHCKGFLDPRPFEISVEPDGTGLRYDMVIRNAQPVPSEISLIAGDVIHNARCVLDHLAWRLATVPSTETDFPIRETPLARNGVNRAASIKGVSNIRAQALVEQLQPYNQPSPTDDLLLILHQLDIQDKHKLSLTTAAASEGVAHDMVQTTTGEAVLTYFWGELREGMPFASVQFKEVPTNFNPRFQVSPYVGIRSMDSPDQIAPAINLLYRILQQTATTVNQFRPFL
jgi:hypothetical protein